MKKIIAEILEKSKGKEYDFDTKGLEPAEVKAIKNLAAEKRFTYGIAPIGRDVFAYISEREPNLFFISSPFDNEKNDALLFIPRPDSDRAYIILNSSQMLITQIFAAAHEYYHYICSLERIKKEQNNAEKGREDIQEERKANRFAAEFLLPSEALRNEIEKLKIVLKIKESEVISKEKLAIICICIVVKYEFPLKAVIYRLIEEKLITTNIDVIMKDYAWIKATMTEIHKNIKNENVMQLFKNENMEISTNDIYLQMERVYNNGFCSISQIKEDAAELGLDMEVIEEILDDDSEIIENEEINIHEGKNL